MKINWKSAVLTALLSLIPWNSSAQVEKITDAVYRDHLKDLPALIKETKNPYLKNHLAALKPEVMQKKAFVTAVRVAADLKDRKDFSGQVIHYAVPAMSELMRCRKYIRLMGKHWLRYESFLRRMNMNRGHFRFIRLPISEKWNSSFPYSKMKMEWNFPQTVWI